MYKEQWFYSPTDNNIRPLSLRDYYENNNKWPEDSRAISDKVHEEFRIKAPPVGKVMAASKRGLPCWVDAPPLTAEQLVYVNTQTLNRQMAEATSVIEPLKSAVENGWADDADTEKLKRWEFYRYQLSRISVTRADIIWPEKPADVA